ncbi:peptidyl-glycine alpha-amidating monooxygenase isoform X1 [Sigmodon hispidus]
MAGRASSLLLLLLLLVLQGSCLAFRNPLSVFKRFKETTRSFSNECLGTTRPITPIDSSDFALDIRMPGVTPKESDTYFCMSMRLPVDEEAFLTSSLVPAWILSIICYFLDAICLHPLEVTGMILITLNHSIILHTFVFHSLASPKGVLYKERWEKLGQFNEFVFSLNNTISRAFCKRGKDNHKDCSGVSLHLTRVPQPLIAGMYLMMSVDTVIPPGEKMVNSDISCHYKMYPMHVFAYRVHTHRLGKVVSGYRVRNGQWTLIGRQSPQLPQAFYPVEHPVDVAFGDILAARCVFTGEGRTEATHIGGTSSDEMCNLYIMYYMEAKYAVSFMTCTQNVAPDMFRTIPAEANIPIPVKSDMIMMHGHHKETENKDKTTLIQQPKHGEEEVLEQGDFYSLLSKLLGEREDVVHVHRYNPAEKADSGSDPVAEIANVVQKKDLGRSDAREGTEREEKGNAILVRDRIHKFHRLESTQRPAESRAFSLLQPGDGPWEPGHSGDFHVEEALDWPGVYLLPGQVSGVALDSQNNLVIFHRGDHVWDGNSFDSKFVYQQRGLGPIEEDTILVIDPNNAAIIQSNGKNLFYLPHGLSIDKDGNYWVTDVALHQVFKLDPHSKEGPLLILGRSMQPGSDQNHFCQPTDVAVDPSTGAVFVADGYCNSRIVQFSPSGKFITQWGEESSGSTPKPGQFSVPHSLALVPHLDQLCVADRENGRIQCFRTDTKEFVREIKHAAFGRNVFAISYIPGLLFVVNGKPYFGDREPVQGFVMNFSSGEIIDVFKPVRKHFDMPHDIVASEDGNVYIGDAHTNTVWKFTLTEKMEHRSVKKAGIEVQEIKEVKLVVESKMENKPTSSELQKMQEKQKLLKEAGSGVPVVLITTLLVIPVVVLLAIVIFIRWKKSRAFGGKGSGGLNLGNFFASRKTYSRKGFDRLSTEGSDQEKDEDDGSESEEEYSAPLPTPAPSS